MGNAVDRRASKERLISHISVGGARGEEGGGGGNDKGMTKRRRGRQLWEYVNDIIGMDVRKIEVFLL